jgi:hypothetical protein
VKGNGTFGNMGNIALSHLYRIWVKGQGMFGNMGNIASE